MKKVPACSCPHCGKELNAATNVDGEGGSPSEGDISLCIGCGGFLTFNKDLTVRELSYDDVVDLKPEERSELFRAKAAWEHMKACGVLS